MSCATSFLIAAACFTRRAFSTVICRVWLRVITSQVNQGKEKRTGAKEWLKGSAREAEVGVWCVLMVVDLLEQLRLGLLDCKRWCNRLHGQTQEPSSSRFQYLNLFGIDTEEC